MNDLLFKIILIVPFFIAFNAKSDHIVGSDITYRCSNTNDSIFYITLNFYRDCRGCYILSQNPKCGTVENCNSSSTAPSELSLKCLSGTEITIIEMTRTSITDITRTCKKVLNKCQQPCNGTYPLGIEKHTFEGTLDLRKEMQKGCCRFKISTRISGRSISITTGPAGDFFYTYFEIDACKAPCNTSQQLTNDPVAILCCNQPYFFNNGSVDNVDNDSLSYSLVSAYSNEKQISKYNIDFSGINPLTPYYPPTKFFPYNDPNTNPPAGIFMDPETGDLIFMPTDCTQQAVVVMQIDEWRKNKKGNYENIGLTRRDMQFIVKNCPGNNPPKITNTIYKYTVCAESKLCFDITTQDKMITNPPPNTIPDTVDISWNEGIPGATFTIKDQKAREKTGIFCWTPKRNQARNLAYNFTVQATDNNCPENASTTRSFTVVVKPIAESKRVIDTLACGKYTIESKPDKNFYYPATYFWEITDSLSQPLAGQSGIFKSSSDTKSIKNKDTMEYIKRGKYIIHHLLNNSINCPFDYFDTLVFPGPIKVDLICRDTMKCPEMPFHIESKVSLGVPGYKYKWFSPGLNTKDTLSFLDIMMNTPDSTFHIEVSDKNKCKARDTITIFRKLSSSLDTSKKDWTIIINPKPNATVSMSDTDGCVPLMVNFTTTINNGVNASTAKYQWDFDDGNSYSTQKINHTFSKIGLNNISLSIISDKGCDTSMKMLVKIFPLPEADFISDPDNRTLSSLPRFSFINKSFINNILGSRLEKNIWDFGEPNIYTDFSFELNPVHFYVGDTGIFPVSLLEVSNYGCRDSITKVVIIDPSLTVFIPTAFTPNKAGIEKNDKFNIYALGYKSYNLVVFNRWGEKLFESDNVQQSWDGTYKGVMCPTDAYVYELRVSAADLKQYRYNGTITLIR